MKEWFMSDPVAAIFYICAVPATVIMVLQTILLLFGLGHDGADVGSDVSGIGDGHFGDYADFDTDSDGIPDAHADFHEDAGGMHGDSGLRLITVRGVVAFFAIGGWSGIAALELGAGRPAAAAAALLMGFAALVLVAVFFRWAMKLQYNGTLSISNAVGKTGEVYLTVPAGNGGHGKVNVIVQERLCELEAVTAGERALRFGERVQVTGMYNENTIIVEPVDK